MMLENQISSIENNNYGYELLDTNIPAIDKLTSATSVSLKYWNPATDDDQSSTNNATAAALIKNGELNKLLTAATAFVFIDKI